MLGVPLKISPSERQESQENSNGVHVWQTVGTQPSFSVAACDMIRIMAGKWVWEAVGEAGLGSEVEGSW